MNMVGTAKLNTAVRIIPSPSYVQWNGTCPSPPMLTVAELACSSKGKLKLDHCAGSGIAMIVSTGDTSPSVAVPPIFAPFGPYWSSDTMSQRRYQFLRLMVAVLLDGSKEKLFSTPLCGVSSLTM